MLNALTASLFLPEFILTLGWCSAKSEAYTLKQRWTKLWWQSHCFQDILRELTQPKTKASPAGAKVVAYSHWLTARYICLCSHINTLAAQPTHGRARRREQRENHHAQGSQELRVSPELWEDRRDCDALAKPGAAPGSPLQHCSISKCSVGLSKGAAKHPKVLNSCKKQE